MVEVHVGAEHDVDRIERKARSLEVLEEGRGVAGRNALDLVGPHAGVDEDRPALGLDDEAVDREHHVAFVVHEARPQPVQVTPPVLLGELGEEPVVGKRREALLDPRDPDASDLPCEIRHGEQ